jgi:predicted nucleic acid-binding protein
MLAVVDTGPLYAAVDADDQDHQICLEALPAPGLRLFGTGLADLNILAPTPEDGHRVTQLVRQDHGFPLGGTDTSVIVLAERLKTDLIITLDRRHFAAVRPQHASSRHLLPD